jgi:hypothetical protein
MRGISQDTIELILFARQLLAAAHPMTLRQLHYAIFSASVIAYTNTMSDYKRLSRATTMARRAYRDWQNDGNDDNQEPPANSIPPSWMVDETRNPETQNVFKDIDKYIDAVGSSYRRDNWQSQPEYCEVWSEKATILASLRPVARELGVTLRVCHGYGSCGMEMQIADHFVDLGKPIHIFYLGDHDPSGHDIERDIHAKVQRDCGFRFTMRRLAIHAADIEAFDLPPQIVKVKDSRSPSFLRKHGNSASTVELDALPADELRQRVRNAVEALIDWELWDRAIGVQKVELASIAEGTAYMRQLLAGAK